MKQNKITKKNRGGARPGAGRKRTAVRSYVIYATSDVAEIIEANGGDNKSEFLCRCVRAWAQLNQVNEDTK